MRRLPHRCRRLLLLASLALTPLTAAVAQAQEPAKPAPQRVSVDMQRAPLLDVVRFYANLTREAFIIADAIDPSMTLTVYAPRPVTIPQARQLLHAALASHGLTLVRVGAFWKVVPAAEGGEVIIGPSGDAGPAAPGLPLQHARAGEVAPILQRLASPGVRVVAWEPTNTLLILASPQEAARLQDLARRLDQPGESRGVHLVPLRHADAEDVADVLQGLSE